MAAGGARRELSFKYSLQEVYKITTHFVCVGVC